MSVKGKFNEALHPRNRDGTFKGKKQSARIPKTDGSAFNGGPLERPRAGDSREAKKAIRQANRARQSLYNDQVVHRQMSKDWGPEFHKDPKVKAKRAQYRAKKKTKLATANRALAAARSRKR